MDPQKVIRKRPAQKPVLYENWKCRACKTTDFEQFYKSGLVPHCYTCTAWRNAVRNCAQKKHKRAGIARKVAFTLLEFHAWAKAHPRICRYCKINDAQYHALGYRTSNGKTLEALGLDRRNDGNYTLDTIDWCCYPCNKTKSNELTPAEMDILAPGLEAIWRKRLGSKSTRKRNYAMINPPHLELARKKPKKHSHTHD
jgi:hypothetical protein